jgi:hypothetical protein
MPDKWRIPLGEEPGNAAERLTEAGRLVGQDLRTTFPDASVTLAFDEVGEPFLLLTGVGCQTPIWVSVDDRQSVNTVAVTELVLDSGMFDTYLAPWPVCPVHPSGSHSLRPVARGQQAAWVCAEANVTVALIGELAAANPGARRGGRSA